jgi:NTP pyrophosphatase (non-canonical NTP hydrolase)
LLCNGLNIDLVEESNKKIKKNMEKYSVDKAVGNSKKYKKMVYLD